LRIRPVPHRRVFSRRVGRSRVEVQRNQFGGNLSGPISKSKRLFFLSTYEIPKSGSPATTTQTLPTDAERGGSFSFTRNPDGSSALIINPFSTPANLSGSGFVRDSFPYNTIPRSRFYAVGAMPTNANNCFGAGTSSWRID